MKRRTRKANKERRAERKAQAKADRDVRGEWLEAVHGTRYHLTLIASDDQWGREARDAVLRNSEVPDGVTHAMLRAAAARALAAL